MCTSNRCAPNLRYILNSLILKHTRKECLVGGCFGFNISLIRNKFSFSRAVTQTGDIKFVGEKKLIGNSLRIMESEQNDFVNNVLIYVLSTYL